MKRKERKFRPDEVMAYKEKMRNYMLHDPMTAEQKKAWNRKPYSYGGTK